jgi:hypothetical protein
VKGRPFYAVVTERGDLVFEFVSQQRAYCLQRFGAGACVDVDVSAHQETRSKRQNSALWALINEWCRLARQGWYPDDLKDAMLGRVFGTVERIEPLTGYVKRCPVEPHTSHLSVGKFCRLIEAILETAASTEPSVYLMAPDEYRQARERAAKQAAALKQAS